MGAGDTGRLAGSPEILGLLLQSVYDDGNGLAAGEAELHDVGELAAGVVDGHVVADHQALQGLAQALKLNQPAGTPLRFRGKHFDALGFGGPVLGEDGLDVRGLQARRRVEKVEDLGGRLNAVL